MSRFYVSLCQYKPDESYNRKNKNNSLTVPTRNAFQNMFVGLFFLSLGKNLVVLAFGSHNWYWVFLEIFLISSTWRVNHTFPIKMHFHTIFVLYTCAQNTVINLNKKQASLWAYFIKCIQICFEYITRSTVCYDLLFGICVSVEYVKCISPWLQPCVYICLEKLLLRRLNIIIYLKKIWIKIQKYFWEKRK